MIKLTRPGTNSARISTLMQVKAAAEKDAKCGIEYLSDDTVADIKLLILQQKEKQQFARENSFSFDDSEVRTNFNFLQELKKWAFNYDLSELLFGRYLLPFSGVVFHSAPAATIIETSKESLVNAEQMVASFLTEPTYLSADLFAKELRASLSLQKQVDILLDSITAEIRYNLRHLSESEKRSVMNSYGIAY